MGLAHAGGMQGEAGGPGLADLSFVLIPAALTGMVLRRGLMQVNSVGRHT
jgi:hypothetical protein